MYFPKRTLNTSSFKVPADYRRKITTYNKKSDRNHPQPRFTVSYTTCFANNEQRNGDYSPRTVAKRRIPLRSRGEKDKRRFPPVIGARNDYRQPDAGTRGIRENDSSELWTTSYALATKTVSWNLVSLRYGHRDIPLTRNARARCVIKPRCNAAGCSGPAAIREIKESAARGTLEEITCMLG